MFKKVGTKIGAGYGAMCALLIICGLVGYFGADRLSQELTFITTQAWDAADGSMEGTIGIQRQMLAVSRLATPDISNSEAQQQRKELNVALDFADEALGRMRASGLIDTAHLKRLDQLMAKQAAARIDLLNALTSRDGHSSALEGTRTTYYETTSSLLDYVEELEELGDSQVESRTETINDIVTGVESAIVVTLVVGVFLSTFIALFSIKTIVRPIKRVARQMHDIAEGEGDLSARLNDHGQDEIAELSRGFNAYTSKIHALVIKVMEATSHLAAASEELSGITHQTADDVSRQREETDQVATAITEMNQTAHDVARSAVAAADATSKADHEAGQGRSVISATMTTINALAEEVGKATEVIHTLEQDSASIGSILDVIREIAEQTNLLALNAAIEAARAGEQGRGFAVVADEVRTLAQRTQKSTGEIHKMIERLQQGTQEAVTVMGRGHDQAVRSVDQAKGAQLSFDTIVDAVTSASDMTTQIASAAEEQNAVSESIGRSVTNIRAGADQNSLSVHQVAATSEDIAQLATRLQSLVTVFKT